MKLYSYIFVWVIMEATITTDVLMTTLHNTEITVHKFFIAILKQSGKGDS